MEILFMGLLLGFRFGNLWEVSMDGSHNVLHYSLYTAASPYISMYSEAVSRTEAEG
jgi:hypothetical protein